mmetsp:Transcript_3928/g.10893  ORF Transcript_3928/g.10893 Transcript_3928/m.10893 type:complete len:249 (+) Transcript_3928:2530-3276(+)
MRAVRKAATTDAAVGSCTTMSRSAVSGSQAARRISWSARHISGTASAGNFSAASTSNFAIASVSSSNASLTSHAVRTSMASRHRKVSPLKSASIPSSTRSCTLRDSALQLLSSASAPSCWEPRRGLQVRSSFVVKSFESEASLGPRKEQLTVRSSTSVVTPLRCMRTGLFLPSLVSAANRSCLDVGVVDHKKQVAELRRGRGVDGTSMRSSYSDGSYPWVALSPSLSFSGFPGSAHRGRGANDGNSGT